jgi:hypothetical protein
MQNYNHQLALIAIVAALALFGVVMVTVATTMQLQQAEAAPGCEKGFPQSAPAFNASKGRCFKG